MIFLPITSRKLTIIQNADFTANLLAPSLTYGANCNYDGKKLNVTGSDDVYFNMAHQCEVEEIYLDFILNSTSAIIRPYKIPYNSSTGTIIGINFSTAKIIVYNGYTTKGTLPSVLSEINITIPITNGNRYKITYEKIFVYDTKITIENVTQNQSQNSIIAHKVFRDIPGIWLPNGGISIYKFQYRSKTKPHPKVIVYGDSITDGNYLVNYTSRWTVSLFNQLGTKLFVNSRAGITSTELLAWLSYDLAAFQPSYFQILIGTNDSTYATWLGNIQSFISQVQAKSIIPVLSTLPPYSAKQSMINQCNAWIRSSGYNYLDYNQVLSVDGLGQTWISAYDNGDGVHPSVSGCQVMYNEIVNKVGNLYGIV